MNAKPSIDLPPTALRRALAGDMRGRTERLAVAGWLCSRGYRPMGAGTAIWGDAHNRFYDIARALKIEATRAAFDPLEKLGWRITHGSSNKLGPLEIGRVRIGGHEGTGPHYSLIGALKKERLI